MNYQFRQVSIDTSTQAAEGLPRHMWTVAEIEALVEMGVFQEHDRFELIGGEIVPMSPKGNRHEVYKAALMYFWLRRIPNSCRIIQETTFRLNKHSFLEPDFVFYDAKVKVPQIAPSNTLLAVEVSDSTLFYDKGRKAKIYAAAGVRALWVINVKTLETHVFSEPGPDGYAQEKIIGAKETLVPDFAPELELKLADLELI